MSNIMTEYLMVVKGAQMPQQQSPELQGKKIKKCSILKEANFSYSNATKGFDSLSSRG